MGNKYFFWPLEGNTGDGMNLPIQRSFFQLQVSATNEEEREKETR